MRGVEALRSRTQEIADALADAMLAGGPPADLVESFGFPLPTTVICELLGVPAEDRDRFRTWAGALLSTTRFTPAEVAGHVRSLEDYMAGLIAPHRQNRRDDLLVAARDDEDQLSEEEMLSLAVALLAAGHETTATQIPNFAYMLLTHPGKIAELRADLDLLPQAVEELLRHVPLGGGHRAGHRLEGQGFDSRSRPHARDLVLESGKPAAGFSARRTGKRSWPGTPAGSSAHLRRRGHPAGGWAAAAAGRLGAIRRDLRRSAGRRALVGQANSAVTFWVS